MWMIHIYTIFQNTACRSSGVARGAVGVIAPRIVLFMQQILAEIILVTNTKYCQLQGAFPP
jgi:hypothetical protein